MPEQVIGWLTQGSALGGIALLLVVIALTIKAAGPELRAWVTMLWARKDAKKAAELEQAKPVDVEKIADAA